MFLYYFDIYYDKEVIFMGNKIFNDSQMEKVHGAGVGNYISGGFKIAAGAALATVSFLGVAAAVNNKNLANKINKSEQAVKIGGSLAGGIAAFASVGLFTDGITQILNEQRISKLEKK